MGRDHVVMCDTDTAKANACRDLGISHFVDDRIEVFELLTTVTRRYLFTGESDTGSGPSFTVEHAPGFKLVRHRA